MQSRTKFTFLLLILAQVAHSVEEYVFRLHDVWEPARFVSLMLSNDLNTGFIIFNATLAVFGLWCYFGSVRTSHGWPRVWIWVWIVIELINGAGHVVIALARGAYFPGLITSPVLFGLALYLALQMKPFPRRDQSA